MAVYIAVSYDEVRAAACVALSKNPAALTEHQTAIAKLLQDEKPGTRLAAANALSQDAKLLQAHSPQMLQNRHPGVRSAARSQSGGNVLYGQYTSVEVDCPN